MNIKSVEVNVFVDHLMCDCGEEYTQDGVVLASYPPQYPYTCHKCGSKTCEDQHYPKVRYEEAERNDPKRN
jgi:hypothetical protein